MRRILLISLLVLTCKATVPLLAGDPSYTRKEVIYARKFGTAFTMDVFAPKKEANGAGIIFVVSGGWFSDRRSIDGNI